MTRAAVTRHRPQPVTSRAPSRDDPQPIGRGGISVGDLADEEYRRRRADRRAAESRATAAGTRAAAAHEQRLRRQRPPMPGGAQKAPTDSAPASSGPQGAPEGKGARRVQKSARRAATGADRTYGRIRRSATKTGARRMLLVELVAMLVATAVVEIAETHEAPSPGAFVPPVVVFLVLGLVSDFSPGAARVAVALGGVILLTTLLGHSAGIVDALRAVAATAGAPTRGGGKGASNR